MLIDKGSEYGVQFDTGGELFQPVSFEDAGFIVEVLDSIGSTANGISPDGNHINFFIWNGNEQAPEKFQSYTTNKYLDLRPRPLSVEHEAEFPKMPEHNYTSTTVKGEVPPLRLVKTVWGDTVATEKKGWPSYGSLEEERDFSNKKF